MPRGGYREKHVPANWHSGGTATVRLPYQKLFEMLALARLLDEGIIGLQYPATLDLKALFEKRFIDGLYTTEYRKGEVHKLKDIKVICPETGQRSQDNIREKLVQLIEQWESASHKAAQKSRDWTKARMLIVELKKLIDSGTNQL